MPVSARRSLKRSKLSGLWFVGRQARGLCVKTCTASQPKLSARSIAVWVPPEEDTCAPKTTRQGYGWADERSRPHGSEPHRLPAHRRRADLPLQLALRAPARRRVPPPDREHGHEPRGRRGGAADPGLAALARDRVGRAGDVPARPARALSGPGAAAPRPGRGLTPRGV